MAGSKRQGCSFHQVFPRVIAMEFRKRQVLQAIVDDYVSTAEPVSSRSIARKYSLGVSPATIRNEMADLEDQGYLEQPHTSAGRVPSDKGYRFYVDFLMPQGAVSEDLRSRVFMSLVEHTREVAGLVQQAARLLAEVTDCLVLVSGPELPPSPCRSIQFMPVRDGRVVAVLVSEDGLLHSASVEVPSGLAADELQHLGLLLSQQLQGITVAQLAGGISRLTRELAVYEVLLLQAVEAWQGQVESGHREQVFLGGTTNLLKQPEFRDVTKAYSVLTALEQEAIARALLAASEADDGISVAIGEEMASPAIQGCSLVTSGYTRGGQTVGRIGVVGPRRMDYARVMAMVGEISRSVSMLLTERLG